MKKDVRLKIGGESTVEGGTVSGNIVVATGDTINYLEGSWVAGVDESNGYVIIGDTNTSGLIGRTTGGGTGVVTETTPTFWKSNDLTDNSLINLINKLPNSPGNFTTLSEARDWLTSQGYWSSSAPNTDFVTGLQTYSVLCTLANDSTQWAIATLNYTNETLTLEPLGFTTDDWYHNDSFPLNESGYIHAFVNNNTNEHKLLFVDAANNIVQTVNLADGSLNIDSYSGKIIVAKYDTTGDIYYFNGLSVYQNSYDITDLSYSDILATSSNGTFMLKTVKNDGSVKIVKLFEGTATTILEYNESLELYEIQFYNQADYYVIFKKVNNIYQEFKIKSISDNTELQAIDLSGFTKQDSSPMEYTAFYYSNYGSGKFVMVLHNWDDSEVEYRIYTYNGVTDVLNAATHVKGANYPQFSVSSDDNSSPDNYDKESVILTFYSNGQWTGSMNLYQYVDLIYQMEWQTTLSTYTFTNTGGYDAGFDVWNGRLSNNYHGICTTNNVDLQVLSITEANGLQITTVGQLANLQNYYIDGFGNKACFRSTSANDGTGLILKYFGDTGTVLDELIINGGNPYTINSYTGYNSCAISHDGILYYINTTTDEIVEIGAWTSTNSYNSSSYYEAPPAIMRNGEETLLFNQDTYEVIIIKPNAYTNGNLPTWDNNTGFNIRVGKDSFMYLFKDPDAGFKIHLYDFNLTLLNSIVTDITDYNFTTRGVKDRFFIRHNDGIGNYRFFMITENFSDSFVAPTSNVSRIENDWIYWN